MAAVLVGIGVAVLAGFGTLFLEMAKSTGKDSAIWWILAWTSFGLAGAAFIGLCLGLLFQHRRQRRAQRFPPGLEPVMTTPPEHRKAEQARRIQQDDSAVMNPLIRAAYAGSKREQIEARRNQPSLQQLRRDTSEIAEFIAKVSDQAALARTDTDAKGFGLSARYLRASAVEEERTIINHFHREVGSYVIAT